MERKWRHFFSVYLLVKIIFCRSVRFRLDRRLLLDDARLVMSRSTFDKGCRPCSSRDHRLESESLREFPVSANFFLGLHFTRQAPMWMNATFCVCDQEGCSVIQEFQGFINTNHFRSFSNVDPVAPGECTIKMNLNLLSGIVWNELL